MSNKNEKSVKIKLSSPFFYFEYEKQEKGASSLWEKFLAAITNLVNLLQFFFMIK